MTSFARLERAALCETARAVGPDAPTLCDGWTVRDLIVHLLVRERRPWASVGGFVPGLGRLSERAAAPLRRRPFEELVDLCAAPSGLMRVEAIDRVVNGAEMFIHHEDIRRAQPDWARRDLSPDAEASLWGAIAVLGRMSARRAGVPLVVTDGSRTMTLRRGDSPVEVTAPVSELLLGLAGRRRLADVHWAATPEQLQTLKAADLSI